MPETPPAPSTARPSEHVRDSRIERVVPLLPPDTLLEELPLGDGHAEVVIAGRSDVQGVLDRSDRRLLVVVGPCSVHDPEATLEYAGRLAALAGELSGELVVVMRVYFEKPRTTVGWKGLINDPDLDGCFDINAGLRLARRVLIDVLDAGLPVGREFLDPITPQYIADVVCWGAIGARTTESQIHRAARLRPVDAGRLQERHRRRRTDRRRRRPRGGHDARLRRLVPSGTPAILHARESRLPHHPARRQGPAQPRRGRRRGRAGAARGGRAAPRLMIDLSHDNSGKDPERQPAVAAAVGAQIAAGNDAIAGVMLESFLVAGRQDLLPGAELRYGQSITDGCIGWETTVEVLEGLASSVRDRAAHEQR